MNTSQSAFFDEVVVETPGEEHLESCLQCGTCGGSCPSGADMDHTPRALFALINAGQRERVLESNTPWFCVSCYSCTVRCPQEIPITDLMYAVKRLAVRAGRYTDTGCPDAPRFSKSFIDTVEHYGRSFELGLFTRFHLRHHPLGSFKMAPMGMTMLRKGRLQLKPNKIKHIKELSAILDKAREIGGVS